MADSPKKSKRTDEEARERRADKIAQARRKPKRPLSDEEVERLAFLKQAL